jgi:predicted component of type VI protein secretion system
MHLRHTVIDLQHGPCLNAPTFSATVTDPYKDPSHPLLIVTGGPRDGAVLSLDTIGFEKLLGSAAGCHLRLEVANVEAQHARIAWEERGLVLSDQGTSTGTYVNGEKVGKEHFLADGDRVCLGPPGSRHSVKLLVRIPESAMAAAQPIRLAPQEEFVLEAPVEAAEEPDDVFVDDAPSSPSGPGPAPPAAAPPPPAAAPPPRPAAAPAPPPAPAAVAPVATQPDKPRPRPEYAPELPSIIPAVTRDDVAVPDLPPPPPHQQAATPVTARSRRSRAARSWASRAAWRCSPSASAPTGCSSMPRSPRSARPGPTSSSRVSR